MEETCGFDLVFSRHARSFKPDLLPNLPILAFNFAHLDIDRHDLIYLHTGWTSIWCTLRAFYPLFETDSMSAIGYGGVGYVSFYLRCRDVTSGLSLLCRLTKYFDVTLRRPMELTIIDSLTPKCLATRRYDSPCIIKATSNILFLDYLEIKFCAIDDVHYLKLRFAFFKCPE